MFKWAHGCYEWPSDAQVIDAGSQTNLPDIHFMSGEAQERVQHQAGGQVINLTQLLHTHSSAAVHGLPPSAC